MATTYLTAADIAALNALVTGQPGLLRDLGLLEGASMRVAAAAYYEEADLAAQGTLLAIAVALAHAFIDGNKRTGLASAMLFWRLNGLRLDASYLVLAQQLEAVVAAQEAERGPLADELARWARQHLWPW